MHVGSHAMLVAAGFLGADGSMAVAAVVVGSALVGAAGGGGGGGARPAQQQLPLGCVQCPRCGSVLRPPPGAPVFGCPCGARLRMGE